MIGADSVASGTVFALIINGLTPRHSNAKLVSERNAKKLAKSGRLFEIINSLFGADTDPLWLVSGNHLKHGHNRLLEWIGKSFCQVRPFGFNTFAIMLVI